MGIWAKDGVRMKLMGSSIMLSGDLNNIYTVQRLFAFWWVTARFRSPLVAFYFHIALLVDGRKIANASLRRSGDLSVEAFAFRLMRSRSPCSCGVFLWFFLV